MNRPHEWLMHLEPVLLHLHSEQWIAIRLLQPHPTPLSLIALIALIFLIALLNQLSTWVQVVKNQLISQLKHHLGVYVACSSPKLLSWPFAFALIRCLEGKDLIVWTSLASRFCPSCYTIFWSLHFHLQIFGASPTTVFMYFLASAFSHQQTWLLPCTKYQPLHQSIRGCIFNG